MITPRRREEIVANFEQVTTKEAYLASPCGPFRKQRDDEVAPIPDLRAVTWHGRFDPKGRLRWCH